MSKRCRALRQRRRHLSNLRCWDIDWTADGLPHLIDSRKTAIYLCGSGNLFLIAFGEISNRYLILAITQSPSSSFPLFGAHNSDPARVRTYDHRLIDRWVP